jgi:nucleotide-binding universal stress UspA family protein
MRILIPVDGSEPSQQAVKTLAHLSPAKQVTMLHAVEVPKPGYPMIMPQVAEDLYRSIEKSMREQGETLLKSVISLVPKDTGPVCTRLEVGEAAEVIVAVAERDHADLILMGSHGRGAITEIVLGSVSHRVVAHAPCPVLVVNRPVPSVRSILLAVDSHEDVDAARRVLSRKPFRSGAEVTVLNVLSLAQPLWPGGLSQTGSLREKALKCAWSFAWEVAGHLSASGYTACALVGMGSPADVILQQAAALNVDLIALGSRPGRALSRFVLGSVSHRVLHRTACPVLVFN